MINDTKFYKIDMFNVKNYIKSIIITCMIGVVLFGISIHFPDKLFFLISVSEKRMICHSLSFALISAVLSLKIPNLYKVLPYVISVPNAVFCASDYNLVTLLTVIPYILLLYNNSKLQLFIGFVENIALYIGAKIWIGCMHDCLNSKTFLFIILFTVIQILQLICVYFCAKPFILSQDKMINKLKESENILIKSKYNVIEFVAESMISHSPYLYTHSKNVELYSRLIGEEYNKNHEDKIDINDLLISARLHDLGKMYIPVSVLDKPSSLTKEERELINTHPIRGTTLFNVLPNDVLSNETKQICSDVILNHHERLDGTGYPNKLKDLSLYTQIVSLANFCDSILSKRTYKKAETFETFIEIIRFENVNKFNQELVDYLELHKKEIVINQLKSNKQTY